MEQFLQKCWEQFELRFFWHWLDSRVARKIVDHILKQCVQKCIKKSYQKSLKIEENWGLEGALGGLGACLEPCWPGLAAEARKCTPDVAKVVQFGANLGVKLEPKSFKKSIKNSLIFVFFFGALLEAKLAPKPLQNGGRNRLQDAFQGAWKRKWWKCDFEQHYHVLAIFWGSPRLGNRRKNWKNLKKILSKFKDTLVIDFGWILCGFWRPSWRQNRINIWLKFDWKFWWKNDQQN